MLARRLGLVTRTIWNQAIYPKYANTVVVTNQVRSYALSRFEPERIGRTRPKLKPRDISQARKSLNPEDVGRPYVHTLGYVDTNEDSPLWQASQRSPASNPEEGLRTLLMGNELLIVERCAVLHVVPSVQEKKVLRLCLPDKLRCSISS